MTARILGVGSRYLAYMTLVAGVAAGDRDLWAMAIRVASHILTANGKSSGIGAATSSTGRQFIAPISLPTRH